MIVSLPLLFIWVLASFIIGLMGANRKTGFTLTFLISLLFSPIVGLIFFLTAGPKEKNSNTAP